MAALGVLGGDESLRPLLDVGYDGLVRRLRDADHGGWLPAVGGVGIHEATDTTKVAYAHAFVTVSYTHLDVYKRQHPPGASQIVSPPSTTRMRSCLLYTSRCV